MTVSVSLLVLFLLSTITTFFFSYMMADELAGMTRKQKNEQGTALGFMVGMCNAAVLATLTGSIINAIGFDHANQAIAVAVSGWFAGNIGVIVTRTVGFFQPARVTRRRSRKRSSCKCSSR